ncbi:flavin reductase like domain-containing protein [Pholiota molesta]|nr:flavin reductase like domain-containing protein [Pholiota molesta]
MSRTIIHRQCRSLSRTLPPTPSLYHDTISYYLRALLCHQIPRHCHPRTSTNIGDNDKPRKLKDDLRRLLRDIAQPVAVVTSFMPSSDLLDSSTVPSTNETTLSSSPTLNGGYGNGNTPIGCKYHGATLSSFTSIAMDPHPLVAFALRIPSRMATTLSLLAFPIPPSSSTSSSLPQTSPTSDPSSHMVINLLSASQASTAVTFSRPDLYPTPFLAGSQSEELKYTLNEDGLPVLHGVVGALSCELVGGPIPLHDLDYFSAGPGAKVKQPVLNNGDVASELFIARIVRVEDVRSLDTDSENEDQEEWERTLPLIYHRRSYTSCHSRPSAKGKK